MDRNMIVRAISGLFFIAIVIGAVMWSYWSNAILFGTIAVLCGYEFYHLRKSLFPGLKLFSIILAILISYASPLIGIYLHWNIILTSAFFLPALVLILIITDLFTADQTGFPNITNGLFAAFYIGIPFMILILFVKGDFHGKLIYDPSLLISFFIVLWSNDTFAYLVGKLIGKNKLWERISPKKTWEGFFGGLIFAVLASIVCAYYFSYDITFKVFVFGITVSIFATLGDLSESLLKRQAGVKDSGNLIPGHGGIMDRFDGVLLSTPALIVTLAIINLLNK